MHVLITAVGKRTEHWSSLFQALTDRTDVQVTVCAADVSVLTQRALEQLGERCDRFRFHLTPHLLGEDRTGHMASILFGPGIGRALKGERPDAIHVIGEAAYLSTLQTVRLRDRYWPGTPVTLYAAQNIVMRFPFPFPFLERRAHRAVGHAFPITPAALQVLRLKGYQGPATVVPLGVDTDAFTPAPARPQRPYTVGFVGRLEPHKGIDDLLRAAERLDCRLLAIGHGSLRGRIEQAAARRPGRVSLVPWADHEQLPSLMARMDVLVLPSVEIVQRHVVPWIGIPLREQFGRVLVEAMACGIPVVGSDVGEIRHVIGPAGLVFPAGDVTALADCLTRIRDDSGLARRLGEAGVSRARSEFAWSRIAESLCRIWRELSRTADSITRSAMSPPTQLGRDPASHSANAATTLSEGGHSGDLK
jgi:glycosyltransferase involved in cell wall biosynthesis